MSWETCTDTCNMFKGLGLGLEVSGSEFQLCSDLEKFARAAKTKQHKLSSLHDRNVSSHSFGH